LLGLAEDFERTAENLTGKNCSADIWESLEDVTETTLRDFFRTFSNRARLDRTFEQLFELGLHVLTKQSIKFATAALLRALLQQLAEHTTATIRRCRCTKRQKRCAYIGSNRRRGRDRWWSW